MTMPFLLLKLLLNKHLMTTTLIRIHTKEARLRLASNP
jgi:hypothetical protein